MTKDPNAPGAEYVYVFNADEWLGMFVTEDTADEWLRRTKIEGAEIVSIREKRPTRQTK
jgi:hypothetical protein